MVNGKLTNNPADVAEALNYYFVDSVVTIAQCFSPKYTEVYPVNTVEQALTLSVLAKFPPLALVDHGLLIIPIHLIGSVSLSSPPVADVWWAHWSRCPVAAVASSKWMLHTGGDWGETPPPTWL